MTRPILAALAAVTPSACSSVTVSSSPASTAGPVSATAQPAGGDLAGLPAHCTARGSGLEVLPDPACTPGGTDSHVTQANVATTICRLGYTRTVRPPASYTEPLKRQLMARYGDTGPLRNYELDHLIPLELGGNPTLPANLWPEPGASPNPKDQVEPDANRAVRSGRLPLADAQRKIAASWVELDHELGVPA
jgi:hypothetical protein